MKNKIKLFMIIFLILSLLYCGKKKSENDSTTPKETKQKNVYQICCWNLEHFSSTASRGFPESPGIPPRTEEQLNALADKLINETAAEVYQFSEIEETEYLARLIAKMGEHWTFDVGVSGSQQKTTFIWNTKFVKVKKSGDLTISDRFFDSQRNRNRLIFDRSPQLLHIVFIDLNGKEMNDVLLIGLHLLSGAWLKEQRQKGMEILIAKLPGFLSENGFDTSEKDIVFLGDLNDATFLDFYDDRPDSEQLNHLFPYMIDKGFICLSGSNYPGTRISGRQIDHIIISIAFDFECIVDNAKVLVPEMDFSEYRVEFTDHFPVLINVKLMEDDD